MLELNSSWRSKLSLRNGYADAELMNPIYKPQLIKEFQPFRLWSASEMKLSQIFTLSNQGVALRSHNVLSSATYRINHTGKEGLFR